jgi:hypothetical protein
MRKKTYGEATTPNLKAAGLRAPGKKKSDWTAPPVMTGAGGGVGGGGAGA